jgi:hypothetical protein
MRPVDNITELDADAKFLSDIWPEGPGKAFYETVNYVSQVKESILSWINDKSICGHPDATHYG